jgi:hypothetical protein
MLAMPQGDNEDLIQISIAASHWPEGPVTSQTGWTVASGG